MNIKIVETSKLNKEILYKRIRGLLAALAISIRNQKKLLTVNTLCFHYAEEYFIFVREG